MYIPFYAGFYFAIAKNTTVHTTWHSCKEYAGRELGARKPKNYVTLTIWNGYKPDGIAYTPDPIGYRAAEVQDYLDKLCQTYKTDQKFRVLKVDSQDGCLHIRVPPVWCDNRITAHLLLTNLRLLLKYGSTYSDEHHLEMADAMLRYGQKVGLDQFNVDMRRINPSNTILGIVQAAHQNWRPVDATN